MMSARLQQALQARLANGGVAAAVLLAQRAEEGLHRVRRAL